MRTEATEHSSGFAHRSHHPICGGRDLAPVIFNPVSLKIVRYSHMFLQRMIRRDMASSLSPTATKNGFNMLNTTMCKPTSHREVMQHPNKLSNAHDDYTTTGLLITSRVSLQR